VNGYLEYIAERMHPTVKYIANLPVLMQDVKIQLKIFFILYAYGFVYTPAVVAVVLIHDRGCRGAANFPLALF
jgi:hypothetical protein